MLILQAERDALLKPLLAVAGIVERRTTQPILSNVLIEQENGQLSCLASDLEIQISATHHEKLPGDDFRLTTSARKLQDILRSLPSGATITLEKQDERLMLKAGKSRFNLQTLPPEQFPLLSVEQVPQNTFNLPQRELKRLISQVQYAMAVQDIRYYLNGLLLQTDGNQIRLIATDGHRLAFASAEVESDLPQAEVILPRKTVMELHKLLTESDDNVLIETLNNQVRFTLGNNLIISKVVDGKFPDYNRVIPLDNDKLFLIDRITLLQALQRAAILANEKFRGVRIVLKPGLLSILCTNSEQEEAQEDLEIAYQGEALEIAFNINYLLDMLNNVPAPTLQLAFGDGSRSTLISIPETDNFKYIVMPMRI